MFDALAVAHQIVRLMARFIDDVAAHDPDLARQMRRAVTSIPLNLAEGRQRAGKDGRHLYRVAAGSAAELGAAVEIAVGLGYASDAGELLALLDRERAMLWRLTH